MLRFVSSLLVMLLGAAITPARRAVSRTGPRVRRPAPHDDEGATDRALEAAERPRARARQAPLRWVGAVDLIHETHIVRVPGTWALESAPLRLDPARTPCEVAALPSVAADAAAWTSRMQRILSFREPGIRLRIGDMGAQGWQTLEVSLPSTPPTLLQVDRDAFSQLVGGLVELQFRILESAAEQSAAPGTH